MKIRGRWRVVEMDAFDADYLDLVEPAYIDIDARGGGEMAFGALTAAIDCSSTPEGLHFEWNGSDEGDTVHGEDWVQLREDGSLLGEISWANGDQTDFKAVLWPSSSTAC